MTKFLVTFLLLSAIIFAAEDSNENKDPIDKNSPITPYLNGTSELKNRNFSEATNWFNTTKKDFPSTDFANQAKIQNIIIYMAYELTNLRLYNLCLSGESNILEESEKLTTAKKERIKKFKEKFKNAAKEYGEKLLNETTDYFKEKPKKEIELSFSIELTDWEKSKETRKELSNGILVTEDDIKSLEKDEFIMNYLGILETIFPGISFDKNKLNPIIQKIDNLAFYNAIGGRLYLVGENTGKKEYYETAKTALNYALEFSSEDKYNKKRKEAQDFLDKANSKLKELKENENKEVRMKKCPKCGTMYKEDFNFCPVDGTKLTIDNKK